MSKVFLLKVCLVFLVLGLMGCTSVTREQIKSVVAEKREHPEERAFECTVIVVAEGSN